MQPKYLYRSAPKKLSFDFYMMLTIDADQPLNDVDQFQPETILKYF